MSGKSCVAMPTTRASGDMAMFNLLNAAAGLLGPFVEDGSPIRVGEARDLLKRLREARNAVSPFNERALQARASLPAPRQTQADANAMWAEHEVKKWAVTFQAGISRRETSRDFYVSSRTIEGAKVAGLEAADLLGQKWARRAVCTARLATAQDLGAIFTGGSTHG